MATEIKDLDNIADENSSSAKVEKLFSTYEEARSSSQLVILQGSPDPDAISSALALEFMAAEFDIETTILVFHNVSHQENRALVKRLGINLVRYTPDLDLSRYRYYSIVDSKKYQTPIDRKLRENGVEFLAFIDHHRDEASPPDAIVVDIRPQYQSTAAMICEYLQELLPQGLVASEESHTRLATALMHGVRSDTGRFTNSSRFDYEAASYLSSCVDSKAIKVIERRVLTPTMLSILEAALVNRSMHDNFIFSHVGFVRQIDRDGIPQAADLLLSREGTDTVLVFGIVDEKTIDGSFRTSSETINPDEFLKGLLGAAPESGQYYGGGNIRDRGGFQIPLGFLSLYDDKEQVYAMAKELIERAFLEHIGKSEDTLIPKP